MAMYGGQAPGDYHRKDSGQAMKTLKLVYKSLRDFRTKRERKWRKKKKYYAQVPVAGARG